MAKERTGETRRLFRETTLDPFPPPGPSVFVRSLFPSGTAFSVINFYERSVMFLPVLGKNYCEFWSERVAQFARRCAIIEERSEKYVDDNLFFQSLNIKPTAYAYGRTKIFFRNPRTVRYGNRRMTRYLRLCPFFRFSFFFFFRNSEFVVVKPYNVLLSFVWLKVWLK